MNAVERTAYLIGHDIVHSLSPPIQNAVAAEAGLAWRYEPWDVEPGALATVLGRLREPSCAGANVTMPHKGAAAELADAGTPVVERSKAANVLVNDDGRLIAHNTDVTAASELLGAQAPALAGARAIIFGAGGAAAATLEALRDLALGDVVIAARRVRSAHALADRAAEWLDAPLRAVDLEAAADAVPDATLLVNATALGMGVDNGSPVAERLLRPGMLVYDYVYRRDRETPLIAAARRRGAQACDGVAHLLAQARPTFRLLSGTSTSRSAMLDALRRAFPRDPVSWALDPPDPSGNGSVEHHK